MTIKAGQNYKILSALGAMIEGGYKDGDVFEVNFVDEEGSGWDDTVWAIYQSDIENGYVELITDNNTPERDNKYLRTITNRHTGESIQADVYDVLKAYDVTCPCMAHGIKKALVPGGRHSKSVYKDKKEAAWSIEESIILNGDKETGEEV